MNMNLSSSWSSWRCILMSDLEFILQLTLLYQVLGIILQGLKLDNDIIVNCTRNTPSKS